MAAQVTAGINSFLESSFDDVIDQFSSGVKVPTLPFTKISTAKIEGLNIWKHYLESATGSKLELMINAVDNTVSVMPVGTIAVDNVATSSQPSSYVPGAESDHKGPSKDKVPRPPNAFIIYRQEWHPKVVQANPTLHNNDISVIIGRKWKAEPEAVREEYKRKAEDAKRQHAINHPGYQYQPRKPCEKKKRMTKTKLAKLRAQVTGAVARDPMADLNEMLAKAANDKQVTVDTFQTPRRQAFPNLQPSQEVDNGPDGQIRSQVAAWNAAHPLLSGQPMAVPFLEMGQPLLDGQESTGVAHRSVPIVFTQPGDIVDAPPPLIPAAAVGIEHNPWCEVDRQELLELEMAGLDWDLFVNSDQLA